MQKRCPNCFEELIEKEKCQHCGYEFSKHSNGEGALTESTFLNERYYIGKLFFKDSISIVYAAYDTITKNKVFIREYSGGGMVPEGNEFYALNDVKSTAVKRYVSYGKSLAAIGMSEICPKIFDVFEEENKGYIVTEFFEGKNLKELLSSGVEISKSSALKIVHQLIKGLRPFHNSHMIFGRICPETVYVLKGSGNIKLFGIGAPFFEPVEDFDLRVEHINPSYAAPELFEETAERGEMTDVYSVAAIFYRLLTDTIPPVSFLIKSGEKLYSPAKLNKNVSSALSNAIMNAMNWQASARTESTETFLAELSAEKVKRHFSSEMFFASIKSVINKGLNVIYDFIKSALKKCFGKKRRINKKAFLIVLLSFVCVLAIGGGAELLIKSINNISDEKNKEESDGWYYGDGTGAVNNASKNNFVFETSSDKKEASKPLSSTDTESETYVSEETEFEQSYSECPNLVNMFIERAEELIERNGFKVGKITYKYSSDYAENNVISQSKKAGIKLDKGTKINLVVSKGEKPEEEKAILPNVIGCELNEAVVKLEEAGFLNITVKYAESHLNIGMVVNQNLKSGETLGVNTNIVITVRGQRVEIPEFTTKRLDEAFKTAKKYELNLKVVLSDGTELTDLTEDEYKNYFVNLQNIMIGSEGYKTQIITVTVDLID